MSSERISGDFFHGFQVSIGVKSSESVTWCLVSPFSERIQCFKVDEVGRNFALRFSGRSRYPTIRMFDTYKLSKHM